MKVPKDVYPLVAMISATLVGATGFTFYSLFKPDVCLNRQKRMTILK